jgi:energy-coupling factor transporter ATP-binding protein EcfA2
MSKITCALSASQIKDLFKYTYKAMQNALEAGEAFNADLFMTSLFEKLAKAKDAETATKFLQQVPSLIYTAAGTNDLVDLDFDVKAVRSLISKFKNPDTGYDFVMKKFRPELTADQLKSQMASVIKSSNEIEETDAPKSGPEAVAEMRPYTSFTTTFVEFVKVDPNKKSANILEKEVVDPARTRTYNTLRAIKNRIVDPGTPFGEVIYQGKKLSLKAVKLTSIKQDMLDETTRKEVVRSIMIAQKGEIEFEGELVIQAKDRVALIIVDQNNQEVFFDEQGNVTTEADGGKIVYQFTRNVRAAADNKLRVTDIYGKNDLVMSPTDLLDLEIRRSGLTVDEYKNLLSESGKTIDDRFREIETQQQAEFKQLKDFNESITKNNKTVFLPFNGVSTGVPPNITINNPTFGQIQTLPFVNKETFKEIRIVKEAIEGFEEGSYTIKINGSRFQIDRANMTADIANKIANVLTNPNLSNKEKYDYASLFMNNNVSKTDTVKRYNIYFNEATGELTLKLRPLTTYQAKQNNVKNDYVAIELTPANMQTIYDGLMDGYFFKGSKASKMTYNEQAIADDQYFDYNIETGKFNRTPSSYIDLIMSFGNTEIYMSPDKDPGFFNSYMHFSLDKTFTDEVKEAVEETKKQLTIAEKKAAVVSALENGAKLTGKVSKDVNAAGYQTETQWTFTDAKGSQIAFYNHSKNITQADLAKDARLVLEKPFTGKNGVYYASPVAVYIDNKLVGWVQEKGYSLGDSVVDKAAAATTETMESAINSPVAESVIEITTPAVEDVVEKSDEEILSPSGVNTPEEDDDIPDFVFNRSAELPNGVTQEQVDAAREWWYNSPLSKHINIEHMSNIVNSNVFARFVAAGKTLAQPGQPLGKIQINAATKGNYVDVYHEAWHVFSQLFLTKNDKIALYNEIRNSNEKWKNLNFLEIEELIAEDFRSYALDPKTKTNMPKRNTIFRRIWNFIKGLFGKKQNINNTSDLKSVKDLFEKLYFADKNPNLLNNYEPLIKNVMWNVLNRGPETINNKEQDALNQQDGKLVANSIDSIFSELIDKSASRGVSKAGSIAILSDSYKNAEGVTNKEAAYTYAKNRIQKQLNNFVKEAESIGTPKNIEEDHRLDIVKDNIRILTAALDNWGDKNSGIVKYHIEKSTFDVVRQKAVTYEIDSSEDPSNEDNSAPDDAGKTERSGFEKKVGENSLEQMASGETLYILKSLFKVKQDGSREKNRLGFDQLADFPTVWNNVTRAIGGIKDPAVMYANLKNASLTFPELKQLVDSKLPDPSNLQNAEEMAITTGFWQDFRKSRVTYIQLTMFQQADGSYMAEVTEASNDITSTIYKFKNKFNASPATKYIDKTAKNNSILNLDNIVKDFGPKGVFDQSKSFEFVRAIGISLDDLTIIKKTLEDKPHIYGLEYIFKIVKRFNELDSDVNASAEAKKYVKKFKEDPITVLSQSIPAGIITSKEYKEKNLLEALAELQGKYGIDGSNFSVLNAERNLVFEHIEDFSASLQVGAINDVKNMRDLWTNGKYQFMSHLNPNMNTFTMRSKILNSIFNVKSLDDQFSRRRDRKLDLNAVSGTQLDDKKTGSNTTSLDKYGKFIQEMHMMLKDGLQEFMRHASKSSSFGARVSGGIVTGRGKGDDSHLYIDIDQFAVPGKAEGFAIENIFIDYISSELERIIKFKANINEFKNYSGYNRVIKNKDGKEIGLAGEFFTAFDDVLSEKTKNELISNISEMDTRDVDFLYNFLDNNSEIKQMITDDVTNYFENQTEKNLDFFNKNKFIDPNLANRLAVFNMSEEDLARTLIKAFTYNSWVHNFEMANLFYSDIAQYNHAKDEGHKRIPGATSGGNGFRTDIGAQDFVNNILNAHTLDPNTGAVLEAKTYAGVLNKQRNVEKYDNFKYNGTFNTAILQDVERSSVYLGQIEKALKKDYQDRLAGASKEALLEQFGKDERKGLANATAAQLRDKIIEKRLVAELKPYKEMTEGDGQGYITIDAYRTLKNLEGKWGKDEEALYQKVIQGKEITADEVVKLFPVYKVQHFGPLANTKLPVNAMHKFALAPLIPSVIKGSDLESLHEQMLADNIQYATFVSGSKVGNVTSNGKPDKIYADENQTELLKPNSAGENGIQFTKNTIYLEYLKNVTAVPNKYKNKTIFSTQLRKLILEGMYDRGRVVDPKFDPFIKAYETAVDEYSKILRLEILNEIGYELKNGKYQGKLDKFLNLVIKELDRREVPQHLIQYIGVTPSGNVTNDLSFHLEADEIEKVLVSLIQKRLVKQKVRGEALVQVASSMTKGLWGAGPQFTKATEEEVRKYLGSNTLPFYNQTADGTSAMKVAVAMQGDFNNIFQAKDLEGNTIGVYDTETVTGKDGKERQVKKLRFKESLDKLNELIKNDDWLNKGNNRKLVTMTAVRIPVQGLNSMEFMEVHHFLAPEAGNLIIPPTEIVAKSGADFDVDKLTTFMPNIDSEGKFAESTMSVEDIDRLIKSSQVKDAAQADRIIKTQKAALENQLITATRNILALPENYANLVRPNETYLLKDIADELEPTVVDYDKYETSNGEGVRYDGEKKVISPTKMFEIGFNIHKQEVNMGGKDGLGIVALKNAIHPIFSSVGAKMPKTYKSAAWNNTLKRYEEGAVDFDMRLLLRHNSENGNITLSDIYDADNIDRVSDLFSHKMNGLVDVEKDSWIFNIQGNLEVIPVLSYLMMAGVPRQTAVYFASQPLVRQYVERQRVMNGPYAKITGNAPTGNRSVKGQAALDVLAGRLDADVLAQANKLKLIDTVKANEADKFIVEFKADKQGKIRPAATYTKDQLINILEKPESAVARLASVKTETEDANLIKTVNNNPVSTENYYYTAKAASEGLSGNFSLDTLTELVDENDTSSPVAIAAFTHFLEIEKQIEGLEALQRVANPDTKTFKTIEEIIQREYDLAMVAMTSKLDPDLVDTLRNDSVLSEFFDNQLVKDLLEPLFILRNNSAVSDYITRVLNERRSEIAAKYGYGEDATRMFINQFKNAIVNYAYQNYMTNFVNERGEVVNVPEMYNDLETVSGSAPRGARVENGKMIVDTKVLDADYADKKYETSSPAKDSYNNRGLSAFAPADDLFQSKASFFKYVMEREYLRSITPIESLEKNKDFLGFLSLVKKKITDDTQAKQKAYEVYLNQKALFNSFNRRALMVVDDYSFTNHFFNVINEFPVLKEKYPVLTQLTEPKVFSGEKVITLNNKGIVKGEVAENYYQNILDLADPTVIKVRNKEDNQRISELFQMLPLVSLYTNGIGYSKYGINKILPYEAFMEKIFEASKIFTANNLNDTTFDDIFAKLVTGNRSVFVDYVSSTAETTELPEIPSVTVTVTPQGLAFGDVASIPGEPAESKLPVIDISSNAKGLGGGLTNPTELAKSKGNIVNSYPVEFNGMVYKDAEAAYQANKKNYKAQGQGPGTTYDLMVQIITAKFRQHPRLLKATTDAGGSEFILNAIHQPTQQNTIWETNGGNYFILALNEAYLNAMTPEPTSPILTGTQPSTSVKVISEDYGVVQAETNPNKEETQKFVDLIKPQIQAQTYKENKGTFANEMFHYGLMWARNNPKANPVKIQKFEGANNNYYNYHSLDQKGNQLPSISVLQPIIDKIQNSLGIDMSDYDSVIGNIYLDNQYVYPHKDTTESITARNYPVIVYTIGNDSGLGIVDNNEGRMTFANDYNTIYLPSGDKLKGYTNEVLTKNGSIYTFGMEGNGRFELTHSTPTNSKKTGEYPPITLPNGKVITNYTITLTFRRAQDLEPGMPTTPAKLTTQAPVTVKALEPVEVKPTRTIKSTDILQARATSIEYTSGQIKALTDVGAMIADKQQGYYLLAGYAGTGKTTIAENIARFSQEKGYEVLVIAPTNKAAKVLSDKLKGSGVRSVSPDTIHKTIYGAPDEVTGEWIPQEPVNNKVIIVDESSMINEDLMKDLVNFVNDRGNIVIFMGDGFQLEQIGTDAGLFASLKDPAVFKRKYDVDINGGVMLTEVRRQTLDSEILKIATIARLDNKIYVPAVSTSDFQVVSNMNTFQNQFAQSMSKNEDAVAVVATNNERILMNQIARRAKFGNITEKLVPNETIISVANSESYRNSESFNVDKIEFSKSINVTMKINNRDVTYEMIASGIIDEKGKYRTLLLIPGLDRPSMYHGEILMASRTNSDLRQFLNSEGLIRSTKEKVILDAKLIIGTYGYAITGHKSQGSQWDKVFVNQNYTAPTWNAARWYYTAITRAANDVVVMANANQTKIAADQVNAKLEADQKAQENSAENIAIKSAVNMSNPDYVTLNNFYNTLALTQKQKLGTLDALYNEYRELPYESSVDEFIDNIKRCKL